MRLMVFGIVLTCLACKSIGGNGSSDVKLYPLKSNVWTQQEIPVCWDTPGRDTEKGWVRAAINETWQAHSVVRFTGWGACSSGSQGIRITVEDTTANPHTLGLGTDLNGVLRGMVLNFDFKNWGAAICLSKREYCIRTIAVHEFGHALGFDHEHNRPENHSKICTPDAHSSGDYLVTPYDLQSVMNYCNPNWSGDGRLSELDIKGLRMMYDQSLPLTIYHPGCTGNSRSPACMSAMHKKCYLTGLGAAAYPQEQGDNEIAFICADASFYAEISYNDLPGCKADAQSTACFAAANRYCDRLGKGGAGVVQELGNNVVGMACIPTAWYRVVKVRDLTALHGECRNSSQAQTPACISAAHRYCQNNGHGVGGIILEIGADDVALSCVKAARYTSAKVR